MRSSGRNPDTGEVQNVHSRGQRCHRMKADEEHQTGPGSQCRTKIVDHCVEKQPHPSPAPKTILSDFEAISIPEG